MDKLYHQELFALIDINNCYVSCERVFNPKLNDKPVVVLSNNDGCVISRSNEAKALNISMAVPWYEIERDAVKAGVQVLSSNYPPYADMSQRFFKILGEHFNEQDLEPYSIDECFIRLSNYSHLFDLEQYCRELVQKIAQWLGLPCCIGIGYSKTQAKLANHFAKKSIIPKFRGRTEAIIVDVFAGVKSANPHKPRLFALISTTLYKVKCRIICVYSLCCNIYQNVIGIHFL